MNNLLALEGLGRLLRGAANILFIDLRREAVHVLDISNVAELRRGGNTLQDLGFFVKLRRRVHFSRSLDLELILLNTQHRRQVVIAEVLEDLVASLDTVHDRHVDVEQDHIEGFASFYHYL
jgi:hypothetical protein